MIMDDYLQKQKNRYDKTWQNSIAHGKENRGNFQADLKFIYNTNLFHKGTAVLEMGCGTGNLCRAVSQMGSDVIGTDISSKAIEYAKTKHPQIEFKVQPAEKTDFQDASFDIVMTFDVIEHLPDIDIHLKEVHRLLKPNGRYLIQTPNKYCNAVYETIKARSFSWKKSHCSLQTPAKLKKNLNKNGFNVSFIKINTINEFTLKKIRPLAFVLKYINTEKLPIWMQTNIFAVASKKINE